MMKIISFNFKKERKIYGEGFCHWWEWLLRN